MTKKHFIALADAVKSMPVRPMRINGVDVPAILFQDVVDYLADFCERENRTFNRQRWFDYIEGLCGPNGGRAPLVNAIAEAGKNPPRDSRP